MTDNTIRDQLAETLDGLLGDRERDTTSREFLATEAADALLADGWRPPAREITDPAELPPGSVVIRDGVAYQREGDHWSMRGTKTRWDKPHGNGPIILLYVPTEEARNA